MSYERNMESAYTCAGMKSGIKFERGQINFRTLFLYYEGSNNTKQC
jgi:hypothetical protein